MEILACSSLADGLYFLQKPSHESSVMVALADLFRIHGPQYRAQCGERMPPSHLRAIHDIARCRTAALGGQLSTCQQCGDDHDSDRSCKNRHCPKCQNDQDEAWRTNHKNVLLPVPHFMVPFTRPEERRALARAYQKTLSHLLVRASSAALLQLAAAPRCIGGRIGMVGVLHPWTRDLLSHPHVHSIVAGGGLAADGPWWPSRPAFLVHVKPLSGLFRATCRDQLHKTDLFPLVDEHVWNTDWVVHAQPVGSGAHAFRSLAPSIFRVAISTNRLLTLAAGHVTLQSKESATAQVKTCQVRAEAFLRRLLPHVLPDRFVKGRYDGLRSPAHRHWLHRAQALLGARRIAPLPTGKAPHDKVPIAARATPRCPTCGSPLLLVETLRSHGRSPPEMCLDSCPALAACPRRHIGCSAPRETCGLWVQKASAPEGIA